MKPRHYSTNHKEKVKMSEYNVKDKLSQREKIALKILMLILVIVKPMGWSHEIAKQLEDLKKAVEES